MPLNTKIKSTILASAMLLAPQVALGASETNLQNPKPHFSFIHAAWMGGWQWQTLTEHLGQKVGYITPDLPGHGADKTDPANITLDNYVERMISKIDKVEGKTILVAHSFGGVVASQIAEIRPEKIDAIVYLCAFMLPNGVSFMDATKGVTTSKVLNNLVFSEDKKTVTIAKDAANLAVAHDIPEDVFENAALHMVAEPVAPLGAKLELTADAYGKVPKYYIECVGDQALPTELQRGMYEQQNVEHVYSIESSHVPMFSKPDEVAGALVDVASREQVRNATEIASQAWKDAFNAGDAAAATAMYEQNAKMVASPFGTFTGHSEIEAFWRDLIGKGATNIEYFNTRLEVLDATTARISSQWRMNVSGGVITNELWALQADGTMLLREDHFAAQ